MHKRRVGVLNAKTPLPGAEYKFRSRKNAECRMQTNMARAAAEAGSALRSTYDRKVQGAAAACQAPFFSRPALNEFLGPENQNLLCCILNAVFCI